jgi:hypothetical protein
MAALTVIAALCVGLAASAAEASRARAARAVRSQAEPLLERAVNLSTALSDANATATTTFLTGGLEPPARRARYLEDLQLASESLTELTRGLTGPPAARSAVALIADQLPRYSGLVETARAGNRQGLPIGAAYMRQASGLLTGTVLPASNQLFDTEAGRLLSGYRSGTSAVAPVVLAVVGGLAVGLLVAMQIRLAAMSRRILNPPVLLATVVLLGTILWALAGMIGEQRALATAQRTGSDPVEVLSATRVLVARAETDQSLTLVSRGSDGTDPLDFARVVRALAPPGGLLAEAAGLEPGGPARTGQHRLTRAFRAYQQRARTIAGRERSGEPQAAAALASSAATIAVGDGLTAALGAQTQIAEARFARATGDASSSLGGLSIGLPVLTALAAALVLTGLRPRLAEYR